jgi:hypothetical protein
MDLFCVVRSPTENCLKQMTDADRLEPLVQQLIQELQVPENMEPRQVLVHWTLQLIKRVERESQLKGAQKLLLVQSTLMALLQKENAVFESSSL